MEQDFSNKSKEELIAEIQTARGELSKSNDELSQTNAQLNKSHVDQQIAAVERETESRLAAIVESSDDAIVSKTLEGIIRSWNAGAQRIFGWAPHEVIGKSINIIIPPERRHEEPKILARLQAGERVDHFQTVRATKDGRLIDVSVTISPVRDGTGKVVGASKIARDITAQKLFERELRAARDAAESANQAKDQFLGALSHELRTPLTPVLAEMSMMETQATLPVEMRERIGMMRRNIETEARLVDDLLDVTRISRGKLLLHQEVVDAHDAIRSAVAMFQPYIDEKGLEVSLGLRAKAHHVWADAGRLQQIFLNLLSNAVKFTPTDHGRIRIQTSNVRGSAAQSAAQSPAESGAEGAGNNNDRLRVDVSDNGVGIDQRMLEKLFTPFEQSSGARRLGGLGLGLSICKALLDMHHGTISATSAGSGAGTTLTVELGTVSPAKAVPSSPSPQTAQALGYRILLVEDHHDTRAVMQRLLASFGCQVVTAGTVREAVELSDRQTFDLLISDIGLPDGTGIQLIREIKSHRPIRGIALSGYGQEEDLARSKEAGFDAHLTKPINMQVLKAAIDKVRQ